MRKEYFICVKRGLAGYHMIHSKKCPFLPDPGKIISLGNFSSPHDAEISGNKYFKRTYRCPFCSKKPGIAVNRAAYYLFEPSEEPVTFESLTPTWESALMCGMN